MFTAPQAVTLSIAGRTNANPSIAAAGDAVGIVWAASVPDGGTDVYCAVSRDGGRSFDTLRSGLPRSDCYDLVYRHGLAVADDGRTLLMGSTTGGLWASGDAGDSWTTVFAHLPPIYAVRFG